jgi:hypothetical protein
MVNRQTSQGDRSKDRPVKKKPKRLGLYKEGKSMMEKIVKETFIPDEEEVKKDDEVIDKEEPDFPNERGSIQYPDVIKEGFKKTPKK